MSLGGITPNQNSCERPSSIKKQPRSVKRMRLMLPPRYTNLVQHDQALYYQWESLYRCIFDTRMDFRFIKPNDKPTAENPAMIPLIPQVPFDENHCGDFWRHMSGRNDWDESIPVPVISVALIRRFLASVHAFSVLGLEAQATAFSSGNDGVIKYLAILPQLNTPTNVTSRDSGTTEFDATEKLKGIEPDQPQFIKRCRIHTHPRWRAFMPATDIFQLYLCGCLFRQSFGIVISPREPEE